MFRYTVSGFLVELSEERATGQRAKQIPRWAGCGLVSCPRQYPAGLYQADDTVRLLAGVEMSPRRQGL